GAGAATAGLSSSGATRIVDITDKTKVVGRNKVVKVSDADPNRCVFVAFAMFPEQPGATSYSVQVKGVSPSKDVPGSGPPFPYDVYVVKLSAPLSLTFKVDDGSHWFPVMSSSTGDGNCAPAYQYAKDHFSIAKATATVTGAATTTTTKTTTTPARKPLPSRGG